MSDSKDSTVTYTDVSSPFGGLSDIRSPGASPSPDYVPGPEYPPSPDFVPEPVYPEFMPPKDKVLQAEEQPLPAAVSATADSPSYVPESDPEEDPEEDDDEDPEEDPVNYPTDGGDGGDDEDKSSDDEEDDDEDDDVDIEEDEEEEEHLAPADSLLPTLHLLLYQLLIMPHLLRRLSRLRPTKVARLLAIPSPPPSPLSPWSSPLP
ncbi:hypothetical protein Tco_1580221 [Tanacetum coccineum]